MNILKEADEILSKIDDTRQYGGVVESLTKTAIVTSELLNKEITAKDIATVFIASKLCRESYSHKDDNLIDAVAYLEMLNQVINQEK